jgi:3-dehydroquinate dehydratase-2
LGPSQPDPRRIDRTRAGQDRSIVTQVLVIHGPNLNMLGIREPEIYGSQRLSEIDDRLKALGKALGDVEVTCFQSNHEGAIVDLIQQHHGKGLIGALINPGGLTHTSVSILDAIRSVDYPFVEVHLSNLHRREPWRTRSLISAGALGVIQGLGWRGYEAALRVLIDRSREEGISG